MAEDTRTRFLYQYHCKRCGLSICGPIRALVEAAKAVHTSSIRQATPSGQLVGIHAPCNLVEVDGILMRPEIADAE